MALNRSPEFMGVTVQMVCVVEIHFESILALTNITSRPTGLIGLKFHASEASGSEENNFNIFFCISMVQTQDTWDGSILDPVTTI